MSQAENHPENLLDAFRIHYRRYERLVLQATQAATDTTVLARLGDEVDEYIRIVNEVN